MSHKRVIKKRGKTYGPYIYESYRDENGDVKKVFSSTVLKKRFDKIEVGTNVRIEFIGLKPSGQGQDYKDFKVFVVEG